MYSNLSPVTSNLPPRPCKGAQGEYNDRIKDTSFMSLMTPQNDIKTERNSNGHEISRVSDSGKKSYINLDSFVSFIGKKTDQVAAGVYLVSDVIDEADPLRHEMRSLALALVASAKSLHLLSALGKHYEFHELVASLAHLRALVDIGETAGEISSMNASILTRELGKIGDAIEILRREGDKGSYGNPSLASARAESVKLPEQGTGNNEHTTSIANESKEVRVQATKSTEEIVRREPSHLKDMSATVSDTKSMSVRLTERAKNDIAERHVRRQSILKVLKQKRVASLNDIKAAIPDVGEKTLQRELMSLSAEGVVRKDGEKRWARYSLAS